MKLPEAFVDEIKPYLDSSELDAFTSALTEDNQPTSIRLNRRKGAVEPSEATLVPWCEDGRYLKERPLFTLDPLLHAGCYYVQEASSMFVWQVLHQLIGEPVRLLDLCAAPGGKTTAAMSALPEGSCVVCNEIDRRRARILAENITKWGNPNVAVTGNAPRDFKGLRHTFDVIVTDVPCSGEGMFRKDEGAIKDWSIQKMNSCTELQRSIVDDIWHCLKPGGLLIYSTCTFNVHEDEENLAYICDELGGEALAIETSPDWHIHQPLTGSRPCYRFMPHFTQGEGIFMAVVRKNDDEVCQPARLRKPLKPVKVTHDVSRWTSCNGRIEQTADGTLRIVPAELQEVHDLLVANGLYLLQSGIELGTIKGKDVIPAHALALSTALDSHAFTMAEVDRETALEYLRGNAIVLDSNVANGYVIICFEGHPLGFVKNMGNRSNNLYPHEWRIKFK